MAPVLPKIASVQVCRKGLRRRQLGWIEGVGTEELFGERLEFQQEVGEAEQFQMQGNGCAMP
jgi:hypothetical protein